MINVLSRLIFSKTNKHGPLSRLCPGQPFSWTKLSSITYLFSVASSQVPGSSGDTVKTCAVSCPPRSYFLGVALWDGFEGLGHVNDFQRAQTLSGNSAALEICAHARSSKSRSSGSGSAHHRLESGRLTLFCRRNVSLITNLLPIFSK